jgi:hypothetical protein
MTILKKIFRMTTAVALIVAGSVASAADGNAPAVEENGFYGSAGISRLDLDVSRGTFRNGAGENVPVNNLNLDFDSVRMISLAAGYNWGRWALELGYEQNLDSGDLKSKQSSASADFDYSNFKVAGAFRSAGTVYFLGKAGFSIPDIDTDVSGLHLQLDNSAFVGFGGGYRFSPVLSLEAEASRSSDQTTAYTLSLRRKF